MKKLIRRYWLAFRKRSIFGKMFVLLVLAICIFAAHLSLRFSESALSASRAPDGILVLGGSHYTEEFAATVALQYPDIPIIVSSGQSRPCAYSTFVEFGGIPWSRVITDYLATDTLTNFTATLPLLRRSEIEHVLIITSDGHWRRAGVLAHIVLGSQGIGYSSQLMKGDGHYETPSKRLLDAIRAALWTVFGEFLIHPFYATDQEINEQLSKVEDTCPSNKIGKLPTATKGAADAKEVQKERLFAAITRGDLDNVELRLVDGADALSVNPDGLSALGLAVSLDNPGIVEALHRRGAEFDTPMPDGRTARELVIPDGKVAKRLALELGILPTSGSQSGQQVGQVAEEAPKITETEAAQLVHLLNPPTVERHASGAVQEISLELVNSGKEAVSGVSVRVKFGLGIIASLNGPKEIAAGATERYSKSFADLTIHIDLAEVALLCSTCPVRERKLQ